MDALYIGLGCGIKTIFGDKPKHCNNSHKRYEFYRIFNSFFQECIEEECGSNFPNISEKFSLDQKLV